MKAKCPHVMTAGKVGVLLGMMSTLHRSTKNKPLYGPRSWSSDSNDCMQKWLTFLPLPCHCAVCYRVAARSIDHGRDINIHAEDFCSSSYYTRHPHDLDTLKTIITSRINNATVMLLSTWNESLERGV